MNCYDVFGHSPPLLRLSRYLRPWKASPPSTVMDPQILLFSGIVLVIACIFLIPWCSGNPANLLLWVDGIKEYSKTIQYVGAFEGEQMGASGVWGCETWLCVRVWGWWRVREGGVHEKLRRNNIDTFSLLIPLCRGWDKGSLPYLKLKAERTWVWFRGGGEAHRQSKILTPVHSTGNRYKLPVNCASPSEFV